MVKSPLSKTYPDIARDWIPEKNLPLTPDKIHAYSKERVWWCCKRGHEYHVSVYSRVRSHGCKICNQSLHTEKARLTKLAKGRLFGQAHPDLVGQWNQARNEFSPYELSVKSHKKVWWQCDNGHEWQSTPKQRSRGDGCPVCSELQRGERVHAWRLKKSGPLSLAYPALLAEWDYERNAIQPDRVTPKSGLKVHWVCKYGHNWQATIVNRTHAGSNCPICNPQSSRLEIFLLCELRAVFNQVVWRERFEGYECDIFVPELGLGLEVDGEYWHREKNHRERQKSHAFSQMGIHLIRVRDSKLPQIEGQIVAYNNGEPSLKITVRLFKEINIAHSNQKLTDYITANKQQNQTEYQQILSRLPAPPSDLTLLSLFPVVAVEWDYKNNYPMTPDLFSPYSDQNVMWICASGHHWKATIKNRTLRQSGCPTCYRATLSADTSKRLLKKLGSLHKDSPTYLKEWDYDKNADLLPSQVTAGSKTKVWWKCSEGHSYQQALTEKKRGRGCPECFNVNRSIVFRKAQIAKGGSLLSKYPHIAKQWDCDKNGGDQPSEYSPGSHQAVWWICDIGHSYKAPIRDRCRQGLDCPLCRPGRQARIFSEARPDLLQFWDATKNVDVSLESVHAYSRQKVWWHCSNGHSYTQAIADKVTGSGCPICAKQQRAETVRLKKLERTGSLRDKFPELVTEWHLSKNGTLQPSDLSAGSHQIAWWRCHVGHEWQESPNRRSDKRRKYGCPICYKMSSGYTTHHEIKEGLAG